MRPTWPARRASVAPGLRARGSRCRLATSAGVNTSIVSQLCGNRELASACRHSHPTSLRTMLVRQPRSPDCPAPRPSARWRSGWPCRWAEANSRLPQRPFAAAVLTPATVTRLHLELRARKPAGVDAHCARQQSPILLLLSQQLTHIQQGLEADLPYEFSLVYSACRHSHPTGLRTRLLRQPGSPDCPTQRAHPPAGAVGGHTGGLKPIRGCHRGRAGQRRSRQPR